MYMRDVYSAEKDGQIHLNWVFLCTMLKNILEHKLLINTP